MREITVALGQRSYPVLVGDGAARRAGDFVVGTALVVRDERAPALTELDAPELVLQGGEAVKTLACLGRVLEALEAARVGRDGTVVAVGGGSICDLAGLAASLWQRGVGLVQVPTTLLAMVDAAIGGKTAINTQQAKNAIGSFWQPRAVLADLRFLATLPPVELRSAQAEIVKYDMTLDPGVSEVDDLEEVVARSAAAKAGVVAADERESGEREVLNYGHTAGHALEAAAGFRIPHGVAVAAGMRVAARLSARTGACPPELVALQDALLARRGLPGELPRLDVDEVMSRLSSDKKSRAGRPRWVLLRNRGEAEPGHAVDDRLVREALTEILER